MNLEVVDAFPVVDPAHVLYQHVQLTASLPGHIDAYDFVPFKDSCSHLWSIY